MSFFTGKKLLLLGFLAVLLAVIPLTVFFLQSQTKTKSHAEKATTLFFALPGQTTAVSTPIQKSVGDVFNLDIVINPGTNQILVTTLFITFDKTKLQLVTDQDRGLVPKLLGSASQTEGFSNILAGPAYTDTTASITLTANAINVLKSTQKIATIYFKAIADAPSTQIAFDPNKTNATSTVDPEINVLKSDPTPATIVIVAQGAPTVAPPLPTLPSSGNVGIGTSAPSSNQIPICTGLNVDRQTTGPAPFSITFTANGNDPTLNGTVNKVTFDYGDGPVQDISQGGGIGNKTVSVQVAHTYNNPGTYTAKAILTDNSNALSKATDCVQTITVIPGSGGSVGIGTTGTPPSLIVTPTNTPTPKPMKPGPSQQIMGIGIVGIGLTLLGGILFFSF